MEGSGILITENEVHVDNINLSHGHDTNCDDYNVMMLHNEKVMKQPACGDNVCSLKQFKHFYSCYGLGKETVSNWEWVNYSFNFFSILAWSYIE